MGAAGQTDRASHEVEKNDTLSTNFPPVELIDIELTQADVNELPRLRVECAS